MAQRERLAAYRDSKSRIMASAPHRSARSTSSTSCPRDHLAIHGDTLGSAAMTT